MPTYEASYALHDRYVHNWLVAGPQTTPVTDLARFAGDELKPQVARACYTKDSGVDSPPVD